MATADFLFQNQAPSSFTATTTDTTALPAWYQAAKQAAITRASEIAATPYQAYQGPRIAGQTDDQTAAQTQVRNAAATGNPYASQAAGALTSAGGGFDQNAFNAYMNPYSDQMNNQIATLGMRNYNENVAPTIDNSFIGQGMFGSSRHADVEQRALRDTQDSILNQQTANLSNNYNNAMTAYGQGQQRTLDSGTQLGALGNDVFNNSIKGSAALDASGQEQQAQTQKNLDLAYGDYQNQLNYPKTQLDYVNSVINGTTPNTTTTSSSTTPTSQTASPLSQLVSNLYQYSALGK